jgi:type III pantothenate kinase
MKPDVVVDVGNTRIKWGRCEASCVAAMASLPPDAPEAWQRQLAHWKVQGPLVWAVSGVHPARRAALIDWLRGQKHSVWQLEKSSQLTTLRVAVPEPDKAGIDRLLNAVAARSRAEPHPDAQGHYKPTIIIDAGSAVTVDFLDEPGDFKGGAIFPGLRLMAQALHDYTALLPTVAIQQPEPDPIGDSTTTAIASGVYYAVAGGINLLIQRYKASSRFDSLVFLTGGDAALLQPGIAWEANLWPEMTLEGIRLAAEAQP